MRQLKISCSQIATAAILAMFSAPAFAQPSTAGDDESIVDDAPSSLNLPGIGGYSLKADVRTLYDSNLLRLGDGLAPRPGTEKSDYRISPSVSGEIGVPLGRQNIFLSGLVGRDYFIRNPRLDRNRFRIEGGVNLVVGTRCSANANVSFNSRQVLVSDLSEFVPSVRHSLLYGATANCQSAVGLGFGGNLQRSEIRNLDSSRSAFDLNTLGYGLHVSYGLGAIGQFQLSGNINNVTYIHRTVPLPDGTLDNDGVKLFSGRFGYSRELGTRMSLTLGVSYFKTDPNPRTILQVVGITSPPDPPGFIVAPIDRAGRSGLGYDVSISYHPSPRLSTVFAARRSAGASPNVGAQSTVSTSYVGHIDYKLCSGIGLDTGVNYSKKTYQNSVIEAPDRFRRRLGDNISRVYGGIGYGRRLLSVRAELAYQKRVSDPMEFSLSGVSASLNLNVKFGRAS